MDNFLIAYGVQFIISLLKSNDNKLAFIFLPISVLISIFMILQACKRLHDINVSGWWQLVPIYNLILFCTDGTPGGNDYGEDPKGRSENQPTNLTETEIDSDETLNDNKGYYVIFDDKEQGPYTLEKMKTLIKEGKINNDSIAMLGENGEWKTLSKFKKLL